MRAALCLALIGILPALLLAGPAEAEIKPMPKPSTTATAAKAPVEKAGKAPAKATRGAGITPIAKPAVKAPAVRTIPKTIVRKVVKAPTVRSRPAVKAPIVPAKPVAKKPATPRVIERVRVGGDAAHRSIIVIPDAAHRSIPVILDAAHRSIPVLRQRPLIPDAAHRSIPVRKVVPFIRDAAHRSIPVVHPKRVKTIYLTSRYGGRARWLPASWGGRVTPPAPLPVMPSVPEPTPLLLVGVEEALPSYEAAWPRWAFTLLGGLALVEVAVLVQLARGRRRFSPG